MVAKKQRIYLKELKASFILSSLSVGFGKLLAVHNFLFFAQTAQLWQCVPIPCFIFSRHFLPSHIDYFFLFFFFMETSIQPSPEFLQKGPLGLTEVLLSALSLSWARLTQTRAPETKSTRYAINQTDTKVHTASNSARGKRHLRRVLEAPLSHPLIQDGFRKFYWGLRVVFFKKSSVTHIFHRIQVSSEWCMMCWGMGNNSSSITLKTWKCNRMWPAQASMWHGAYKLKPSTGGLLLLVIESGCSDCWSNVFWTREQTGRFWVQQGSQRFWNLSPALCQLLQDLHILILHAHSCQNDIARDSFHFLSCWGLNQGTTHAR